jgi:hypothetical protein
MVFFLIKRNGGGKWKPLINYFCFFVSLEGRVFSREFYWTLDACKISQVRHRKIQKLQAIFSRVIRLYWIKIRSLFSHIRSSFIGNWCSKTSKVQYNVYDFSAIFDFWTNSGTNSKSGPRLYIGDSSCKTVNILKTVSFSNLKLHRFRGGQNLLFTSNLLPLYSFFCLTYWPGFFFASCR